MRKLKVMFMIFIFQNILLASSIYPKVDSGMKYSSLNNFYIERYHRIISSVYISNDNKYVISGSLVPLR